MCEYGCKEIHSEIVGLSETSKCISYARKRRLNLFLETLFESINQQPPAIGPRWLAEKNLKA